MKAKTLTPIKPMVRPKPKYKVGNLVQYDFVDGLIIAQVVEDRGTIGYKGRRLYRIVGKDGSLTRVLEMPEEELMPFVRDTPDKTS